MTGIGRIAWLLLTANRLQRWLLGMGLGTATAAMIHQALAPSAPSPVIAFAGVLGLAFALIGPLLTGGLLFRDVSAPRAASLIPAGRRRLLFGAVLEQLLMSVMMAAALHRLLGAPHAPALLTAFAIAFGFSTLFFLSFFCTSGLRYGSLLWLILILGVPAARLLEVAGHPLQEFLLMPRGIDSLLALEGFAWLCFGVIYLNVRQIRAVSWDGLRTRHQSQAARNTVLRERALPATPAGAVRMLLTGNPHHWLQGCLRAALIVALCLILPVALPFMATHGHSTGPAAHVRVLIVCAFAGPAAALFACAGLERVRTLWLVAGLGRLELLKIVERNAWYTLGLTAALACIATVVLRMAAADAAGADRLIAPLALPLTSGAAFLYVNLLRVRGPNPLDRLIMAGFTALLGFQVICAMIGVDSALLDYLVAFEALLAAVLRALVVRRWQRIDWLVFKPGLQWGRLVR